MENTHQLIRHKKFSVSALLILLFLATFALFTSGCSSKPSSLVASTSPLPPGVRGTIPARGSDCQYHLLGLVPITFSPDSQNALAKAKRNAEVEVLTDVTIDHTSGYYILFSNNCVRVSGLGVRNEHLNGEHLNGY
jgi:hypothetical protein